MSNGLNDDVKEHIRLAANKWWKQMFAENDIYLTGLVIDSHYRGIDLGIKDLNLLVVGKIKIGGSSELAKSTLPELVHTAANYLLNIMQKEYAWRQKIAGPEACKAIGQLKEQVPQFVKGAYSFNQKVLLKDGSQQWWDQLNADKTLLNDTQPLAQLKSTLFLMVPNSMANERTGSTFTWLNGHLRNCLKVPTLVCMMQVRQWIQYEPAVSLHLALLGTMNDTYYNQGSLPVSHPTVKFQGMKTLLTAPQTSQKRKNPPSNDDTVSTDSSESSDEDKSSDEDSKDSVVSDKEELAEEDDMTLPGEWVAASFADLKLPALCDMLSPMSCMPAAPCTQPKASHMQRTPSAIVVADSDWQM
ncbi:uncharacterized protein PHACADRAFT_23796 [Phanerochaete carnosa HHB-10118-sp]|uniref:Uncharacterized protein n=1 Tax=Phanerochaete carnosa (strain HHB-10118-sp) TaxID=650164 RepID=K5W966_PHACS|nr:uncharacterized protein PHACADRAFT_23796 [Phanerochaete carnosa HHB-10118-sp]EKM60483.1 hypothetical protein PHACADRAFT_23796 [Phanerochaete carnosa HHB-10118-sp]